MDKCSVLETITKNIFTIKFRLIFITNNCKLVLWVLEIHLSQLNKSMFKHKQHILIVVQSVCQYCRVRISWRVNSCIIRACKVYFNKYIGRRKLSKANTYSNTYLLMIQNIIKFNCIYEFKPPGPILLDIKAILPLRIRKEMILFKVH